MSFLSKALTVVGAVAGIAAAVATGGALGFLAAGLIGLGAASSLGLVGGSIGKFMNSGIGRGLVLAAGAYAAIGAFNAASGGSALQANATEAGAQQAATAGSSASAVNATTAASLGDTAAAPIPGLAGATDGTATNALASAASSPDLAQAANVDYTSMQQAAQAEQATQSGVQTTNSVAEASGHQMLGEGPEGGPSGTIPGSSPAATQQAVSSANAPMGSGATSPNLQPQINTPTDANGMAAAPQMSGNAIPGGGPGTSDPGGGGFLSSAMKFMDTKGGAAMITAGGSLLSGLGQGIAQKQATEDAIRAQQWSNNRWTTPGLANQAVQASQGDINVPGGYLQRAAAVRNLANNSNIPYGPTSGPVPVSALPGASAAFGGVPGPAKG